VNYAQEDYWSTQSTPNSWIQFDFKDRVVSLTHYALKSDGHSYHLLQWTLSGSMDGETWTILDRQNTQDLNGIYKTKIFPCGESSSQGEFSRYIRLSHTGKDSTGNYYLMLAKIEFFGSLANAATARLVSH
jgi:hypothetical protein